MIPTSPLKSVMKRAGIENICTLSKLDQTTSPYVIAAKQEMERLRAAKYAVQTEIDQVIERRKELAKLLAK